MTSQRNVSDDAYPYVSILKATPVYLRLPTHPHVAAPKASFLYYGGADSDHPNHLPRPRDECCWGVPVETLSAGTQVPPLRHPIIQPSGSPMHALSSKIPAVFSLPMPQKHRVSSADSRWKTTYYMQPRDSLDRNDSAKEER